MVGMLKLRTQAINGYAVKLLTSGYPLVTVRRILISGIRGYEAGVKRREQAGIPLYRTASESGNSRKEEGYGEIHVVQGWWRGEE